MRKISHCLNPALTSICKRAIELESLTVMIQAYLPEHCRGACSVGSFNKGCLTLVLNDPKWASELRYRLPELRDQLRQNQGLYQLGSIKLGIQDY